MTTILVTGGAGYIGSHTTLTLLNHGYDVVVLDNLCNSSSESLIRVAELSGRVPIFLHGDIRDRALLDRIFSDNKIDAVLHFAGLKAVSESVAQPLLYYDNNVYGSQVLLQAMAQAGVYSLVFSSSATVYGQTTEIPISENCPITRPVNPYGRSKLMVEDILQDLVQTDDRWRFAILRYFNPIGAHESGLIGEDPRDKPHNLMPYMAQVASGKLPELTIYGNDYPTSDGTGVRDYIHVLDLANGHLCALKAIQDRLGVHIWNLGTGRGYSVLEMVHAFEKVCGQTVRFSIAARRSGDIAICYADCSKANRELGWQATRNLNAMMEDTWRWQKLNPNGYQQGNSSNGT